METPIAKLVIKDLITGDGAKEELVLTVDKIQLLEQKIIFTSLKLFCINILTLTTKRTTCPRGEIGRHK